MAQLTQYVLKHGVLLLFTLVLLEQAGVPLPSAPVLLSVGSFATSGNMDVTNALIAAASACLVADGFWYSVGRSSQSQFRFPSAATNDWQKQLGLKVVSLKKRAIVLSAGKNVRIRLRRSRFNATHPIREPSFWRASLFE